MGFSLYTFVRTASAERGSSASAFKVVGPVTSQIFPVTNSTDNARWVGNGGSDAWTDSNNWQSNNNPTATSSTITYYGDISGRTYTDMSGYGSFFSTGSFYFDATSTQYNLGGTNTASNTVRLFTSIENGPSYVAAGIAQPTQTFSAILALGGNASFIARNGSLIINSANIYGDNHSLTLTGTAGKFISLTGSLANGNTANGLSLNIDTITATLSGNNVYSGATTIAGTATVNVNSATAFGTSTVTLNGGAVLDNTSGAAVTLSNGNAFISNGNLVYSTSTGTVANSLNLGTGTFSYNGDRTTTLNGAGAFTIGTLTQTANGATTFTVNNGTGTAATSVFALQGFQLTATGDTVARTQVVGGSAAIAITGPITNGGSAGGINYTGTGSLTISGSGNTYTGGINNNGGTGKLNINSATALGVGGTLTLTSGILDNTSGAALTTTTSNPVVLNGDSGFGATGDTTANSLTINGATVSTSGGRTITLNGAGALAFTGAFTNTSNGGFTTVFNLGTGTAATTSVSFGGLALSTGTSQTVTITGSAPVNITGAVTNGTGATNNLTYGGSGVLTLSGNDTLTGLTKVTTGTLTLSGNNSSASGGVSITGGKLNVNSATALGTGTFTINGGTTDNTSGAAITETTNPAVTLTGDFALGNSAGTAANNLNLGTGTVTTTGGRTATLNGTGTVSFGPLYYNSTGAQTFVVNNGTGTSAASAIAFAGLALSNGNSVTDGFNGSGNVNITGPVTNGAGTGNGLNYTGSGILNLSGNNTLTGLTNVNSGTGTVTISGNNTAASGGVRIQAGKININSATALGTGIFSVVGTGTIDNTSGAAVTETTNNPITLSASLNFSTSAGTANNNLNLGTGAIAATGSPTITMNGAGALTFGGVLTNGNTGGQTLTVNNGTGAITTSVLSLGGYTLTGAADTALQIDTVNGSGLVNITGPVTNGTFAASGLTYNGTGALTLSGASTYTGQTTLSSGALNLTGSTSGSNISVTGGTFTESTAGVIAGTGTTFNITGGTTTLAGQNTYTGNTLVQTGTLNIASDSTLTGSTLTSGPLGTGILGLNADTIAATGGAHTIYNVVAPTNDNAGTVGGSQALTFGGQFSLSALGNHYTTLTVNNSALTTFSGGINISGQQLTLNGSGSILVNSAIIGNANFVTYSGSSTLTMSGANTYQGPTNVNSGTLLVNGTNSGTGTVATVSGATLGGSGTIAGSVNVVSGSSLAPGATGGNSTAIFTTGALTLAGNYKIDLQGATAGTGYDQVKTTGALTLTTSSSALVFNSVNSSALYAGEKFYIILNGSTTAVSNTFNGAAQGSTVSDGFGDTYSISYTDNGDGGTLANDVSLTVLTFTGGGAVPEPSTWLGGALVLGSLGYTRRRQVRRWLGATGQMA